jgi:para-aminobenzoate synthetase component 1
MICQSLPYHPDITHYFSAFADLTGAVLFDSGKPHSSQGKQDIFSALPQKTLRIQEGKYTLCEEENHRELEGIQQVTEVLNHDWQSQQSEHPFSSLAFSSGWMGHANYELLHYLELGKALPEKPSQLPVFWAGYYQWAIVNDHKTKTCQFIYSKDLPAERLSLIKSCLSKAIELTQTKTDTPFTPLIDETAYQSSFNQIKHHINEGNCYQVNYTFPFKATYSGNPFSAYKQLREKSPNPFMAYLNGDEYQILSVSPERFLKANNQKVSTKPIKGTSKRAPNNPLNDKALANTLKASDKNRAENVMIVDLLRNDLSIMAKPHSVKVDKLCEVESFPSVHHLASTISAELADGKTIWDLFFSAFPGGSITGTPKKRVCEIINTLEPHPRGAYCGSLFYASNNGNFDSNIAIRTLTCHNNTLTANVGGGIVADSTADNEFEECEVKIRHLLNSLS